MNLKILLTPCLLLLTVLLTGCGPSLNVKASKELVPSDIYAVEIDPISKEQKVTITASSDQPFSVHLFLVKNIDDAERAITLDKESEFIIAQGVDTKQATVSGTIAANEMAMVRFMSMSNETGTINYTISN